MNQLFPDASPSKGNLVKSIEKIQTLKDLKSGNTLSSKLLLKNIHPEIKQADKMTDNQQHAFVREHFSNKIRS